VDGIELLERQRRAVESLRAYDGPELLSAVEDLALTLRETAADEALWSDLIEGSESPAEREKLVGLVLVDWEALLAEAGLADGDRIADELTDAIAEGAGSPEAWAAVREQLDTLARLLLEDVAAPEPIEDRGWWGRLRSRAAHGASVLRRVSIGSILAGAVKGGAFGAGGHLAASLIFGIPFGPAGPIVAAAIAGLGRASYEELRRCLREDAREREGKGLDELFSDQAMQLGGLGFCRKYLDVIEDLVVGEGRGADDALVLSSLAELRRWGAHVGARITAALPLIAALGGDATMRSATILIERLADFRGAVISLARAVASLEPAFVGDAVRLAREAFGEAEAMLHRLFRDLGDDGFGPAAHDRP
jgi:hypothetical protein